MQTIENVEHILELFSTTLSIPSILFAGGEISGGTTRNPKQYYKYAEEKRAKIVAVFETHPHADFVSGHLQIYEETGASIYVSEKMVLVSRT